MHTDVRTTRRAAETAKDTQSFSERPPLRGSRAPLPSNPAAADPALSPNSPGGGEGLNFWRRTSAVVVGLALAATLASCGSDDAPTPKPTPTQSAPTTETTSEAPSWEDAYSAEQLAAYREALARADAFERDSQSIYAEGKASPEAKKILEEYFFTYQYLWSPLKYLEKNGIKTVGDVKVLSSKATRIVVTGKEGSVTIRQCVDASGTTTTQNGKVLEPAYALKHEREIALSTPTGGGKYLILSYENKDTPCDA